MLHLGLFNDDNNDNNDRKLAIFSVVESTPTDVWCSYERHRYYALLFLWIIQQESGQLVRLKNVQGDQIFIRKIWNGGALCALDEKGAVIDQTLEIYNWVQVLQDFLSRELSL